MLARLGKFERQVGVIGGSGIQFIDLGIKYDPRRDEAVFLHRNNDSCSVPILLEDKEGAYWSPAFEGREPRLVGKPTGTLSGGDTLKALERCWLPLPYFRIRADRTYVTGPFNWVRVWLATLATPDEFGNTVRVTIAVDTTLLAHRDETTYLAPSPEDIERGSAFDLAWRYQEACGFVGLPWLNNWLRQVWVGRQRDHRGELVSQEELVERDREFPYQYQAHYLHLLRILGTCGIVPQLKMLTNGAESIRGTVPVDLVIDVGNSRTACVLVENHPDAQGSLTNSYTLEVRDLSEAHQVYNEPFESRVEFGLAEFGLPEFSRESGRNDAFVWPTIARVGVEASRLASRRRGTEGATGLSSPKRYLWDVDPFPLEWRFNASRGRGDLCAEPAANSGSFAQFINEAGDALYALEADDPANLPVFRPTYSRSSLMTFLLAEIVVQAIQAVNQPAQRLRLANSDLPRYVARLILTIPPAMPIQEQAILRRRVEESCRVVWQALGWCAGYTDGAAPMGWPPVPEIVMQWDEATCAQVVYLYTEVARHFAGDAMRFFDTVRKPRTPDRQRADTIRIGAIDIGGGTTDLVVTDYRVEGSGTNVSIIPREVFRDGFPIAGDDLLKRVVQGVVLPLIEREMARAGAQEPGALLREILGPHRANEDVRDRTLKQQVTRQILVPVGLALLGAYEQYRPEEVVQALPQAVAQIVGDDIDGAIFAYLESAAEARGARGVSLRDLVVPFDMVALDHLVREGTELTGVLEALAEIVASCDCDVLLYSGRPSRLPGVRAILEASLPVPPDRLIAMYGFHTGGWYPFHKLERIADPKTTAAVGAMLCLLSRGRLSDFALRSDLFSRRSVARIIGKVTGEHQILQGDVYFTDVKFDDEAYELPDREFEFRGQMWLGSRQLPVERWRATRLYALDFADRESRDRFYAKTPLKVRIARARRKPDAQGTSPFSESLVVASFSTVDGAEHRRGLSLRLQTLDSRDGYWLDTGIVRES